MDDTRLWVGAGAAAAVAIAAASWFGLIGPQLAMVSSHHADADAARVADAALASKVTALRQQSEHLSDLTGQLRTVRTQLPILEGLPAYFGQLGTEAGHSQVAITSVAVGAVTAALSTTTATTPSTTDATGSTATASPTPTPTASTSATGTTTGTTAATITAGPAGQLFQVALTVVTTGSLARQEAFLDAVQSLGTRTTLVTSAGFSAGQGSGSGRGSESTSIVDGSTMTTALTIFVAPQTAAAAALLSKQLSLRSTK